MISTDPTVWPAATVTTVGEATGVEAELVGAGVVGVGGVVGVDEDPELGGVAAVPPHPSKDSKESKTRALFTIAKLPLSVYRDEIFANQSCQI